MACSRLAVGKLGEALGSVMLLDAAVKLGRIEIRTICTDCVLRPLTLIARLILVAFDLSSPALKASQCWSSRPLGRSRNCSRMLIVHDKESLARLLLRLRNTKKKKRKKWD
jgi:hypothetical protein